jgi:hypothetical protein
MTGEITSIRDLKIARKKEHSGEEVRWLNERWGTIKGEGRDG